MRTAALTQKVCIWVVAPLMLCQCKPSTPAVSNQTTEPVYSIDSSKSTWIIRKVGVEYPYISLQNGRNAFRTDDSHIVDSLLYNNYRAEGIYELKAESIVRKDSAFIVNSEKWPADLIDAVYCYAIIDTMHTDPLINHFFVHKTRSSAVVIGVHSIMGNEVKIFPLTCFIGKIARYMPDVKGLTNMSNQ